MSERETANQLNPGERYRPARRFKEVVVIPTGVVEHPRLSWSAKVLFGILYRHSDRKTGECEMTMAEIGTAMCGASVDTVSRWLKELASEKFISRTRRGDGQSAMIAFIWHPCLDSDSANLRSLPEDSDSAEMRSLNDFRVRNSAVQTPQTCGSESANLRSLSSFKKEYRENKSFDASELAQRLYARHPKKKWKVLAEQALCELLGSNPNPDKLAERIDRSHAAHCHLPEWNKDRGQFAPVLANWLRDRGFEDEIPTAQPSQSEYPEL